MNCASSSRNPGKQPHRPKLAETGARLLRQPRAALTQLQFVLTENPLSRRSLDLMDRLQDAIANDLPSEIKGAQIHVLGLTSSIHDLRTVTDGDQLRIEMLVVAVVFLILLIALRRLIVTLYLIASVLLSFGCALGATVALFWALDPAGFAGLDWKRAHLPVHDFGGHRRGLQHFPDDTHP